MVGDTGLEPVTSPVSGERASQTAPIALRKRTCEENIRAELGGATSAQSRRADVRGGDGI